MGDESKEPARFSSPIEIEFGRKTLRLEPLRGLKRLQAFEAAILEEIYAFKGRIEEKKLQINDPEQLLIQAVDVPRLLRLASEEITDELIEESTANERMGTLTSALYLNNLGRFTVFLAPEMLLEIGMKLTRDAPVFPLPESSPPSFEPESVTETSNTN